MNQTRFSKIEIIDVVKQAEAGISVKELMRKYGVCKQTRVNILFSYGLVGRGGDAVQTASMIDALISLGHTVRVAGPTLLHPYQFSGKTGHIRSGLRRLPWWAKDGIDIGLSVIGLAKVRRLLAQNEVDLILHRSSLYDLIGANLPKSVGCPLITYLDAPWPLERAFRKEGYFARFHRRTMRKMAERANLMVTVSQSSKEYYTALGLPVEKILVQPNGISGHLLQKGTILAKAHPPLTKPTRTLGFLGSLSRWHRVDLLLEALVILKHKGEGSLHLRIVGYGEEFEKLRQKAEALGVAEQVNWIGALSHEQAFSQIAQFDIAVLPHTLSSGAPMKLVEYAAVSRPIVAPSLPNLHRLFSEDEICFVKPKSPQALAQAISRLLRAPEMARKLGERAWIRARQYTWERIMDEILATLSHAK